LQVPAINGYDGKLDGFGFKTSLLTVNYIHRKNLIFTFTKVGMPLHGLIATQHQPKHFPAVREL